MKVPSLVLFDMDDVLCRYDRPARIAYLARLAGSTPEAIYAAIWGSGFEDRADDGTLDTDAYLRGYGERIGYRLTLDDWVEARRVATIPCPEILELVRQVRKRARIAVLTNNPILIADQIGRIFPELPPLFADAVFASAQFRVAKPDPECFRRCVAVLGEAPGDTLFIDDRAEHVEGARRAGLLGYHHTSTPALAEALREFGLL